MSSRKHGRLAGDADGLRPPVALDFENGGLAARIAAAGAVVITDTGEQVVSLRLGVDPMTPFDPVLAVAGISRAGMERITITALSAHLESTVWRVTGDVVPAGRVAELCDQACGILMTSGCRPVTSAILPSVRPYVGLRPGCPVVVYTEAGGWSDGRVVLPIGLVDTTSGPAVLSATDGVAGGAPSLETIPLRDLRNADFGEAGYSDGVRAHGAWRSLTGHAGHAALDRAIGGDFLIAVGEIPGLSTIVAPLLEAQHRAANETPEMADSLITAATLAGPQSEMRPDAEGRETAPAPSP